MERTSGTRSVRALKLRKFSAADAVIHAVLMLLALLTIFPFYNVVIVSFGDAAAMAKQLVYLFPTSVDLSSYKLIMGESRFLYSFFVSVFVTVAGTALNMGVTLAGAYALSKSSLPGRKIIMTAIIFSMFFSGGLVPYYLTVKSLGLIDSLFVMIVPMAVNTFYLIIVMTFFRTLPAALEESAKIDGANDIQIMIRIILPISLPTIAAITLFYAVERWNEWYHGMLFITDIHKFPLQTLLREIMISYNQIMQNSAASSAAGAILKVQPQSLKMAVVVISTLPILCLYPFLQKYFAKGVLIGSVKG